jgi:hypothetical protein
MKRIAVITKYYNSWNFGGLLQAYALVQYLCNTGYDAFQISYNEKVKSTIKTTSDVSQSFHNICFSAKCKRIKTKLFKKSRSIITKLFLEKKMAVRREASREFRNSIPHTDTVYDLDSVRESNILADCFITGSDRVWSERTIGDPYYLSFAEGKAKISFAASLRANDLTGSQKEAMKETLSGFKAISVREKDTIDILSPLSPVEVDWVLDPTFLLSAKEWSEISEMDPGHISDAYILCYFLGDDRNNRKLAKQFAKKKNLKIVTLPYSKGEFCSADIGFGDYRCYQVSPPKFISLIKNAQYIMTDSFHASVFSSVFHKQFIAFSREELKNSGTRIESLLGLMGISDHFCGECEKQTLDYITALPEIDYQYVDANIGEMKEHTYAFLKKALDSYFCEQDDSQ